MLYRLPPKKPRQDLAPSSWTRRPVGHGAPRWMRAGRRHQPAELPAGRLRQRQLRGLFGAGAAGTVERVAATGGGMEDGCGGLDWEKGSKSEVDWTGKGFSSSMGPRWVGWERVGRGTS